MRILVVGAGPAGLTAAAYLGRAGHHVAIIEWSPVLRAHGHPVDLWGGAVDVLRDLGIEPHARRAATRITRSSTQYGRWKVTAPVRPLAALVSTDHLEIFRGDLVNLLRDAAGPVAIRTNAAAVSLEPAGDTVRVGLSDGLNEDWDLVIGADGVHSTVRRLAFGPDFEKPLDLVVGGFSVEEPGDVGAIERRLAPDATAWSFPFPQESRRGYGFLARVEDDGGRRAPHQVLMDIRARLDWPARRTLTAGLAAADFYFDRIIQVCMPRWSAGRVVLVGDAAWSPGMAIGGGASLAVSGAARLGRALSAAGGSHAEVLDDWETSVRPAASAAADIAAAMGRALVPATRTRALATLAALGLVGSAPEALRRRMAFLPPQALAGLRAVAALSPAPGSPGHRP